MTADQERKKKVKARVEWWLHDQAFKAPEQLTAHYYECMCEDIACVAVGETSDAASTRLDGRRT